MSKWQFSDPRTSEVATFRLNPQSGGSPTYEKTFGKEVSVTATSFVDANVGTSIIIENGDQPLTFEFDGIILEQEDYEMFVTWFEKSYPFYLLDDLGRSFLIYVKSFQSTRVWSGIYFWRHSYNFSAVILGTSDL